MIGKGVSPAGADDQRTPNPMISGSGSGRALVTSAVWMGVASTIGFGALAWFVVQNPSGTVDLRMLAWMRQEASPMWDVAGRWVSYLGSEAITVLVVALLIGLAIKRYWRVAGLLVATVGGAQLLNNVLKELFHRTRPMPVAGLIPAQQYSFPSGHAMVSAAFYLFVLWLCWELVPGWAQIPLLASLAFICIAIGIARMYVGAHYFSDVVAGGLAGFAWADAVLLAARASLRRSLRMTKVVVPTSGEM